MGLRASQPFGLRYRFRTRPNDQRVWQFVKRFHPLILILTFSCVVWSALNWNGNYARNREEALSRQQSERRQIGLACSLAKWQLDHGVHFVLEQPLHSHALQEPELVALTNPPDVCVVHGHACALNSRTPSGKIDGETSVFVTSDAGVAKEIGRARPAVGST